MTAFEAFENLQEADKIWQTIPKGAKRRDLHAAFGKSLYVSITQL